MAGEYVAWPEDDVGAWTIGVRTLWFWWNDPERNYLAVIDPTMHVLTTTGHGAGMAWITQFSNSHLWRHDAGFPYHLFT